MTTEHFDDEAFVERYVAQGPSRFVPGFEAVHRMTAMLVAESAAEDGSILVLGAGGGHELTRLAALGRGWRFCAVDPSAEMLQAARYRMKAQGAEDQVEWIDGAIDDAPHGPFDAATCLLTLHFVADDGSKLATLQSIRARLRPDARFVFVDLCMSRGAADFEQALDRYARYAERAGAEPDDVDETTNRIRAGRLNSVTPERNVELLVTAGFTSIELFYAGLSWRGWAMRA